jgi:hypothetical protein
VGGRIEKTERLALVQTGLQCQKHLKPRSDKRQPLLFYLSLLAVPAVANRRETPWPPRRMLPAHV